MEQQRPVRPRLAHYERRTTVVPTRRPAAPVTLATAVSPPPQRTLTYTIHGPSLKGAKKLGRFFVPAANWLGDRSVRIFTPKRRRALGSFLAKTKVRVGIGLLLFLVVAGEALPILQEHHTTHTYELGRAGSLLSATNPLMADKLKFNAKEQRYDFNAGYSPQASGGNVLGSAGPQITASIAADPTKGVTVTDPQNNIDFTVTPKFGLLPAKQDGNRVVYPLTDGSGWVVYTMHGIGVKEDLLLNRSGSDEQTFTYAMDLGSSLVARVQKDGSLGVYGSTLLSGNVATASSKDADLLQKARQKAPKNTLLFSIPAPVVKQLNKKQPPVKAAYAVAGNTLKVTVTGLRNAQYPLTIDPSIYVETAEKFMKGNNETNIDFDVADTLIRKRPTTGARFDAWNNSMALPVSVWNQGTAAGGGYVYSVGGETATGTVFTTAGVNSYTVPAGVTSVTIKAWGGGGGGAAGSNSSGVGGSGGGGGYATTTATVSPGDTLSVIVGSGGAKAAANRNGGYGGGYSSVTNTAGSQLLVQAGGGGGGGAANGTNAGHAGGAGGCTTVLTACAGAAGTGGGGGAASNSAVGAGGSVGTGGAAGSAGVGNNGGDAGGSSTSCSTNVSGNAGGADPSNQNGEGGKGGTAGSCEDAGGGGGGYFGGGGGGSASTNSGRTAGGGGGGSSFACSTGCSGGSTSQGSSTSPGNSGDAIRNGAGDGGAGGTKATTSNGGASGLVYIYYGTGGTSVTNSVNWAKFDTSTGAITSPDPGTGSCTGWCTASAYALPAGRAGFSTLIYNGFMYVIGGISTTTGTLTNTIYIAKLGANGEPQLWYPGNGTHVYWYSSANTLPDNIAYGSAVAYNDKLYILGGKSTTNPNGDAIVRVADLIPTGDISAWSSTGMTQLSSGATARFGLSAEVYNSTIYVIGGNNAGTLKSDVYYMHLKSDGTMASSSWTQTTSFSTARMSWGGKFTTIWGGYIYLSGGCSAVNGSGYCTTVASDTQLASINADGSLDNWNTNAAVSDQRMGYGLLAWRGTSDQSGGTLYEFGGCSAQNTTDGTCVVSGTDNSLNTATYGTINHDGDASTVGTSAASGTAPCSGTTPSSCNLPSASVGNVLNETAIMNGYLYIMGGCTSNACTSVSTGVTYQAIGSDGSLQKPATCTGTYTDSYCVSSSNLPVGLAAGATATFNGRIYIVGGFTTGTNIYYVSVNTDGSLSSWTTNANINSVTGGAATTLTYSYAFARANPASAGTTPGNLYIFGGCTDGTVGCSNYTDGVFKCNLGTTGAVSACSKTGQLQIGAVMDNTGGTSCGTGLGAMAGAVYANYIYLIGGLTPNCTDLTSARYAKIDNSNNIVTVGSGWVEGTNQTATGRRRGAGYGYNGYLYVVGGYDGTSGVLADIEFAKINVSDGSWGAWSVSNVTINQRWGLSVPVSNSFAYVVGGCTAGAAPSSCTTRTNTIQTFQIYNNDSGAPAAYSTSANTYGTNPNRIGASATVLNGYLYVAGGCTVMNTSGVCTTAVNTVSYSAIDTNGGLGTWSNTTGVFPSSAVRTWGKLEAAGGTLYYIGGQSSTETDERAEVFYGTPSSGNVSTWAQASNGLPAARTKFGAAVWNNRLYVVGGLDTTATDTATVYVSPQLNSGGDITSAWSTSSTSLSVARYGAMVTAYANNLYVFGGNDGTNYLNDSQYAQISTSTGNVGSWTYSTSLPTPLAQGDSFAANGYIYIVGGRSATTTCRPITLVTPVSANTSIATGNNPTGVGEWFETNAKYTGDRYGNAAAYSGGKTYVLGGGCGSTLAYGSPVTQQSAVLSQPQLAQYSIMFDTDTDVFPSKWLLNGIDNSIGASWQLSYRSMKNTTSACNGSAMTTWGQTTNVGNVTLGTPGTYTPKDGSGTNTSCARFYYLSVTIDSSQAYGYPDDVSRGPTINDLTLEFTADPSKRLMHGRTFTGGLQQPDDTPF